MDSKDKVINDLLSRIAKLEYEVERLNNIINKGIEYIQDRYDGEVLTHTFDKCNVGELLEILESELQDKLQELKGSDKE